jgi:hypothetical protein
MMEGPKTIAGEKGTVSERSFVMVRTSETVVDGADSLDQA